MILKYLQVSVWPIVALVLGLAYRGIIQSILPGTKLHLRLFGVGIETTLPQFENALTMSLGEPLTSEQWEWLKRLNECHHLLPEINDENGKRQKDAKQLRPIRNRGLVRTCPPGSYLENKNATTLAVAVEITELGRLVLKGQKI